MSILCVFAAWNVLWQACAIFLGWMQETWFSSIFSVLTLPWPPLKQTTMAEICPCKNEQERKEKHQNDPCIRSPPIKQHPNKLFLVLLFYYIIFHFSFSVCLVILLVKHFFEPFRPASLSMFYRCDVIGITWCS